MRFTDLFIHRPVIAISISLIILLTGLWGLTHLPLSLYPRVTVPIVNINTVYPGASPEVIQNYVTSALQSNLSGISGVDYVTSQSNQSMSSINLYFQLGEDLDQAVSAVMRRVQSATDELPAGTLVPTISAGENDNYYFILQATSPKASLEWTTDYLNRMVVPQLELMDGVSDVFVWGPSYEMNIQLDPQKLYAHNLSAQQVINALQKYNTPGAPGSTYGHNVNYSLNPNTTLHTQEEFNHLIVKNAGTQSIYLKDVGEALFHSTNEDVHAYFNGIQGDAIGIAVNVNSNPLTVANNLYDTLPRLQAHLPGQIALGVIFDISRFIRSSLHEVIKAIFESLFVVVVVMLILLGSPRTVMIPLSTIPLSLIGVCFVMWLCHFTFNTLTLLAMVLAIGLVVDDAIVVVENIVRHIENGKTTFNATLIGAREIAGPVIAMTLTLAAVYSPMLLASGITGHLFTEFAMTLASSVLISGIIALTLSPYLCSRLITHEALQHAWVIKAEKRVTKLFKIYINKLQIILQPANRKKTIILWLGVLLCCALFYESTPHELVPEEDTGILQLAAKAPPDANLNFLEKYRPDIEKILNQQQSNITGYIEILRDNVMFGYVSLYDWSKRHTSSEKLLATLQGDLNKIAGLSSFVSHISLLPGTDSNNSLNLVLVGNVDYPTLYQAAKKLEHIAQSSGHFLYLQDNLQFNQPQIDFQINQDAAIAMNVTPNSIASQLTNLLSQGRIQQFSWLGRSYDVKLSIPQEYRRNPEDIGNLTISNEEGKLIPINSVTTLTTSIVPQTLNQFQKMNSVTITAMTSPGTGFSDALKILQHIADEQLDKNIFLDYSGMTRQFFQEGHRTLWVFMMAVLMIFLILSIQFNRFRDAFVILLGSVPLALFGALLPLWLGLGTINIFTQIGLLTLVGLISKHGILLTEFANNAIVHQKLTPLDAIIQSAQLRFRPIMMTSAAMIVGALPLVFASGAGAESRHAIGIVIVFGMGIGTIFTLFVVPVLYLWFGRKNFEKNDG